MLWLLIGYMWLFIHRPFEIWPALGAIRFELLYMLLTGGIWLMYPGKRWLPSPLHRAFFAFAGVMIACCLVSPWAEQGFVILDVYLKQMVFYVVLVTVVHEEGNLKRVCQAFGVIMTLYMLHSLLDFARGHFHYRMGIVRLLGVDSTMNDPNSFAATLVCAVALMPAQWATSSSLRWRAFMVFYALLTTGCIALTGSRSGFLAFVLCLGLMILRSRWRNQLAIAAILAAPVMWAALPSHLQGRFETIVNPDAGPLNAKVSAEGRLEGFWLGVELWEGNPLTGCGPGAWKPATKKDLESHNLYGQVMGELGTLGIITLAAVIVLFWRTARSIRRVYRENGWEPDFIYHLGWCLISALLMLLVTGNFGHNLYRYTWLWYGAFAIIARHCVLQRLARATEDATETEHPLPTSPGWAHAPA
jgi:hypothetical protein